MTLLYLENGDFTGKLVFARKLDSEGDAADLLGCDSCVSALDDACLLTCSLRGVEAALAAQAAAASCRKENVRKLQLFSTRSLVAPAARGRLPPLPVPASTRASATRRPESSLSGSPSRSLFSSPQG